MATQDTPHSPAETAPDPVTAAQIAALVLTANGFLAKLGAYPALKASGIGLSEWLTLVVLGSGDGSNKNLARTLGLSKQRVNQITDQLKTAGYIDVAKSAEDARKATITLTEKGTAQLATLNATLTPVFASAYEGKERALSLADKSLKRLTRGLASGKAAAPAEAEA